MRSFSITAEERIANKVNGRINFKHEFNQDKGKYTVKVQEVYAGKNPSTEFADKHKAIGEIFEDSERFSFIEGIKSETGEYNLSCYVVTDNLDSAIGVAKAKKVDYITETVDGESKKLKL